jgi:hypothetical protein
VWLRFGLVLEETPDDLAEVLPAHLLPLVSAMWLGEGSQLPHAELLLVGVRMFLYGCMNLSDWAERDGASKLTA